MTPPAPLAQTLEAHGDTLYRMALLLSPDERAAARLLVRLADALLPADGPAPADEVALLGRLYALASPAPDAPRPPRRALRAARAAGASPISGPLRALPLDQRLAVGAHLLLGYDGPRIARALAGGTAGAPPDQAAAGRSALEAAVRALAPSAGASITDQIEGETCHAVRAALVDPASHTRQLGVVRGHLATCARCRSFEQSWLAVTRSVEGTLRAALRERALPAPLAARLLDRGRPRRSLAPSLRLILPPLAVLALIAALVLPGFGRSTLTVVERDAADASADPRALVAQALALHLTPPAAGPPIWHGRYETLWYFSERTVAPLGAEIWLDRDSPARHRLQLSHIDGGAPYELQLGDGRDRLYYALDAAYAPAIYGDLPVRIAADSPALLASSLDRAGQAAAAAERVASGPWAIAPAYLRQAAAAADLRLLGRQRDGDRAVQIVSFSGYSPLGPPVDAPGAAADRVTVLLALDLADGRLARATELVGPPGGTQTSRVTWRLASEEWLVTSEQVRSAFSIERAWTGQTELPTRPAHQLADAGLPLISRANTADPVDLLLSARAPLWLPAAPPPGVGRALLIWPQGARVGGAPPEGLAYLGPGRRLLLALGRLPGAAATGEPEMIGDWRATISPARGDRYRVALERPAAGRGDVSGQIAIDAVGFSAAELRALVAAMRPFDAAALQAQAALFASAAGEGLSARTALLGLLSADPPATMAQLTRSELYIRPAPTADGFPYAAPPAGGLPATTARETWRAPLDGAPALVTVSRDLAGGPPLAVGLTSARVAWQQSRAFDTLTLLEPPARPDDARLLARPLIDQIALDMLRRPGAGLRLTVDPAGGALLSRSELPIWGEALAALRGPELPALPYVADLQPLAVVTELSLDAAGRPVALAIDAESVNGERVPLLRYELRGQADLPLEEAPLALRYGEPPAAIFTDDRSRVEGRPQLGPISLPPADLGRMRPAPAFALQGDPAPLVVGIMGPPVSSWQEPAAGPLVTSIMRGLAGGLLYSVPPAAGSPADAVGETLLLAQGPADPLRAFLRSYDFATRAPPEPITLEIAGAPRAGWLVRYAADDSDQVTLLVEIDETLLLIGARAPWLAAGGADLLAAIARGNP